ncbi:MAG: hypothetical protein WAV09_03400 [Minisyncoccia bacterium]
MTSKKWMKKCRKNLPAKTCKKIARSLSARKPSRAPHSRIKACKKSDPTIKKITRYIASNMMGVLAGDGSGAEDRFDYAVDDTRKDLTSRCGPKFAKQVVKAARKLAY